MLIYCKRCEAPNPDSRVTCGKCGSALKHIPPNTRETIATKTPSRALLAIAETLVYALVFVVAVVTAIVAFGISVVRDTASNDATRIVAAIYAAVIIFLLDAHMRRR